MADEYDYRPRRGFDIRVTPTKGSRTNKKSWKKKDEKICDHPDCEVKAESRVAKSPHELTSYLWMCVQHAREHNKNWNFFANMSEDEQKAFQEQNRYGGRPTWKMAQNARASAAAKAGLGGASEIDDAVGVFAQTPGASSTVDNDAVMRAGRRLTKLQVDSFKSMNLKTDATSAEIRKKYAELVKRFHPDSNEGDRGAEEQLQAVIKAHQILKKAGFC